MDKRTRLEAPAGLEGRAAGLYLTLAREYPAPLTETVKLQLADLAHALAELEAQRAKLATENYVSDGDRGGVKGNPRARAVAGLRAAVVKWMAELGLTRATAARRGLEAGEDEADYLLDGNWTPEPPAGKVQ